MSVALVDHVRKLVALRSLRPFVVCAEERKCQICALPDYRKAGIPLRSAIAVIDSGVGDRIQVCEVHLDRAVRALIAIYPIFSEVAS